MHPGYQSEWLYSTICFLSVKHYLHIGISSLFGTPYIIHTMMLIMIVMVMTTPSGVIFIMLPFFTNKPHGSL